MGLRATRLFLVMLMAAGLVLAQTVTALADDPPDSPAAIDFVSTWTNDDGGGAGGDGPASTEYTHPDFGSGSVDPGEPGADYGIDPLGFYDKDVASCTAVINTSSAAVLNVTVTNGYPQYVCTFAGTFANTLSFPIDSVSTQTGPVDAGLEVTQVGSDPAPGTLGPGEEATVVYAARVLYSAPQLSTLTFEILITLEDDESLTLAGRESVTTAQGADASSDIDAAASANLPTAAATPSVRVLAAEALPQTGQNIAASALIGIVLALVGSVLVVASKRTWTGR